MDLIGLGPLFEFGKSIIDRVIPDPAKKAEAELELLKMTQNGELTVVVEQLKINAIEAANPNTFVSGWRPFTGWICAFGLLYATVLHNILEWISVIRTWPVPPAVDTETLIYVLCALLGIGGMRSLEKIRGIAAK